VGVHVKLWKPLRTRAIPERFCGGDSLRRGAISSVCTFTFYLYKTSGTGSNLEWSHEQLLLLLLLSGWLNRKLVVRDFGASILYTDIMILYRKCQPVSFLTSAVSLRISIASS